MTRAPLIGPRLCPRLIQTWVAANVLCAAAPASAQFMDGTKLLDLCEKSPSIVEGYAAALVDDASLASTRVTKAGALVEMKRFICVPDRATLSQARDLVCSYIHTHPENRHWPATILVNNAIVAAWRCPE